MRKKDEECEAQERKLEEEARARKAKEEEAAALESEKWEGPFLLMLKVQQRVRHKTMVKVCSTTLWNT
ncbi:hypothetical protein SORBI_3004G100600 [Sorghum bicolor]|uniref:Uncharacterized protein n=1 Tax=Sorghum bicolor TaxID=4558 RepID=A0A194YNQ7_SORBI|nr:hypothetical protein SORBI_3004G100600 [Sorghum bicolor]